MANQKKQSEREAPAAAPVKLLAALACFGVAALLVYLAVAAPEANTAMNDIRCVMLGVAGALAPLLALLLIWVGVLLVFSWRGRRVRVLNVVMNALLFLTAFTAVELFFVDRVVNWSINESGLYRHMPMSLPDFIARAYRFQGGAGALGALLAYPLKNALGSWGGLIVCLLVAVICLTATGRMQQLLRWGRERAEEHQDRREERRRQRDDEQMFGYDELDPPQLRAPARPERTSRARRSAEMPSREAPRPRRNAAREDSITLDTPVRSRSAAREDSIALDTPVRRNPPRKKIYRETVDVDAAETQSAADDVGIDIPKPLRRIRQQQTPPAPKAEPPREAPVEDPDNLFTVHTDADDAFVPEKYEAPAPKSAKPRRVVEGVRALKLDDDAPEPAPQPEEDDDAPFDIPHTASAKPAVPRLKRRQPEPEPEEEGYNYPPIDLLEQSTDARDASVYQQADREKANSLIETLRNFGIETRLIGVAHGPAVTCFELQPAPGIKVSRITALADDIALRLAALSVRIEAPIPGKAAVGVEIPNDHVEMVRLRDVLESPEARRHPSRIAVGLGKDNSGRYIVADIAKMPHVLIAGQTGSGKSVCINSIITSILYRATPEEVLLIMIDPKVVELSIYNDIPHLIAPVVTDPKKAASALDWAVAEMETRYKRFAERSVRDIKGYNKALAPDEKMMPQMVIVIDELADLMMVAPGDVEDSICRLAQKARAAGMHLVIATQRPSVNVITGIIKANIPSRIAFSVSSQIDSRTIIDHGGAERLLGNGDMLFVPSGINKPIRVQGAWVSDEEVNAVVSYIKERSETTYDEDVVEKIENAVRSDAEREEVINEYDPKLAEAVEIVVEAGQASVSMLQRRMRVGYARAGRLIDEMEKRGIVSEADGAKPRTVLISREQMMNMFDTEE